MTSTTLKIGGMTCGGCASSVTKALQGEAGVSKVEVLLAEGLAKVDYDAALTNPQQLADAVDDIGFEASCEA